MKCSNSGGGTTFVMEIRGWTDQLNVKQTKVFKYIYRFQQGFGCIIIYYDIWNQFIAKFLSYQGMVW